MAEDNKQIELSDFAVKALTDWKNEPSLQTLKTDLTEALVDHNLQETKISEWLDNYHVRGKAKPAKIKGRSSIQPRLIRKQAEWRYPALSEPFLSTEDIFNVAPVSHGDKAAAIQNELVLNNQFNTQLDKIRIIDETVRCAVDEGTVIFRLGWEYEEEVVTEIQPIIEYLPNLDPNALQQEEALHLMMQQYPDEYNQLPEEVKGAHDLFMTTGQPHIGQIVGEEEVEVVNVIKNQPTLEVCDYRDVILDPTAKGNSDKLQFIVYRFETTKSELEKSSIDYKNLDKIQLEASSPRADSDNTHPEQTNFSFKDEPRKKLLAYEYWGFYDIHGTGVTVPFVATWVGNTLIRMEESPFPDKQLPFVIVPYLPVRNSLYGEPDGELLLDNQKIVGAVTRGMIDIMGRSANGQIGIRQDALDITNRRKYENGQDYMFNPTVDPRTAIIHHTYPEIPQSAAYMLDNQYADAESMSGVKAFHSGISGTALGDNVGGIKSALDATSKRELAILRRLAEGFKKIGRKIIAMNAVFLSDVEVIRVTNEQFVEVRRDDLQGKFDLKLSISTPEADNEKAQELAFMLQTLGNTQAPGLTQIIQSDIARLRKMPELAAEIKNFRPEPDPMAIRKAELEIALLEAQVANERAKGNENSVDVELKSAKAATERAKARDMSSNADLKDLDFLRKEAGVDHQQELEKKDADRRSQLDLKAADILLTPRGQQTL